MQFHVSLSVSTLIASILAAAPAAGAPVVLLNDTFDSPTATPLDDADDAADAAFYAFNGGSLDVVNGALRVRGAQGSRFGSAAFTPANLGIGDSMSFGFDVSGTYSGINLIPSFRIGVFGSGDTQVAGSADGASAADDAGYTLGVNASDVFSGVVYEDVPTSLDRTTEPGGFYGGVAFTSGTQNVRLELGRWNHDLYTLRVFVNGAQRAESGFARSPTTTFDNVQFGFLDAGVPDALLLDNIKVTYTAVPEPACLGLLASAGSVLLLRRRHA